MRNSRSLAGRMPLAARLVSPIVDFTNFQMSCQVLVTALLSVNYQYLEIGHHHIAAGSMAAAYVDRVTGAFHAHLFIHSSHLFHLESYRLAPRFYDHPCVTSYHTVRIAHAVISVDSRHGGSRPMIAAESGTAAAGAA